MNSTTSLILVFLAIVANGAAASLPSLEIGTAITVKCLEPSDVTINDVIQATDLTLTLDLTAPLHCSSSKLDLMDRKPTAEAKAAMIPLPFTPVYTFENVTLLVLMAGEGYLLALWH